VTSDAKVVAVVCSGLLLAGWGLQPVVRSTGRATEKAAESVGAVERDAAIGPGTSAAMLGGCRALAADGLWLRTYLAWSAGNLPATQTLIRLVTMVDERPLYFWLNGARMLAYDMTYWRLAKAGAAGSVPAEVRARIVAEQAGIALHYLESARRHHPHSAELCVEMGNIELNLEADPAAAARWYREAAEMPDAPYYAARIYAELLRRLGRPRDAYVWLRHLHATLPPDDAAAMPGVVLQRIRDLEEVLAIPPGEKYAPPPRKSARAPMMNDGLTGLRGVTYQPLVQTPDQTHGRHFRQPRSGS
jgi:hypothetical protein